MKKNPGWRLAVLLATALFILGACGSGSDPQATPSPTAAPTQAPTAVPPTTSSTDPSGAEENTIPEAEPGYCEAAPLPTLPVRPVDETDWVKGASNDDAEITIFEYSDFQCPGCGGMYPVLQDFLDANPNVQLVYRHFPLDFHDKAFVTSEAAEAAGAQGKFWEMHNLLFDKKAEWEQLTPEEAEAKMSDYAEELGLDVERFEKELADDVYVAKIQSQYEESRDLGLPGTPTFLFNGIIFPSDLGLSYTSLEVFLSLLSNQDELFFDAPPELTVTEDDSYKATLNTTKGDIVVNLITESSPTHVNNFVFLASEGWYDGSDFFFVRDNFVAVSGDPSNSTIGYPGYYCGGEETGTFDKVGLLGMLSNGQFFLTLGSEASQLTGQFALIGEVVEGLEVLDELTRVAIGDPMASPPDVVESITIAQQ